MNVNPKRLMLLILGTVILTYCLPVAFAWKYTYTRKIEEALRQETFPETHSKEYWEIIKVLQGRDSGTRSIRKSALRCIQNEYKDRWGNYPVIYGAIDLLDNSDASINALADLVHRYGEEPRLLHKAQRGLLSRLASLSEGAAFHSHNDKERLAGLPPALLNIVLPLAYDDDIELRCLALKSLAGLQNANVVPLAADAISESSPKRLRISAFKAALIFAVIKGDASDEILAKILVDALKSDDDELRLRILFDFSQPLNLHLKEELVTGMLDDKNPSIAARGLRLLQETDEEEAVVHALAWLAGDSPALRRHATIFLSENAREVAPAILLELCNSPKLSVRFSTLRISCTRRRNTQDRQTATAYREVSERLSEDPDSRLAVMAKWYAGNRSLYKEGGLAEQVLYQECLEGRGKDSKATHQLVSRNQAGNNRDEWIDKQREIIVKARSVFPAGSTESVDPVKRELYALLIRKFTSSSSSFPIIVSVPASRHKMGLHMTREAPLILTAEELVTLRDDYCYRGSAISFSEIFYDAVEEEAWVHVGIYNGPLNGVGTGVILKRVNGIWTIHTERRLWIS